MSDDKNSNKFTFPALALSVATGGPPAIALSLLLVDIGEAFGTPVGIMGQISTVSSMASIIVALLMGGLSIRFQHRSLLVTGLVAITAAMVGCSLSTGFTQMMAFYTLVGTGYAMVLPMTTTLIAEFYPIEKRTMMLGRLYAGRSVSSIVATPIIGIITGYGGWRLGFVGFSLPIILLALLLVARGVKLHSHISEQRDRISLFSGYRDVLSNRSALGCLVGGALAMVLFWGVSIYNGSYLRQAFDLPMSTVSLLMPITAISVTIGTLTSGRVTDRFGRKPTVLATTFLAAVFYMVYFLGWLGIWLSLAFSALGAIATGIRITASSSLTLEQVPEFRGPMMSISTAALSIGGVIGASAGGMALIRFGYAGLGALICSLSVVATFIYLAVVKDPTR